MNSFEKNRRGVRKQMTVGVVTVCLMIMGLFLISMTATANPATTTIHVCDSMSNGLKNVEISYYNGYWRSLGKTDSNGYLVTDAVPDGTWLFRASYGGTSEQKNGDAGSTINFQTAKATAHVTKSDGTDFPGVYIQYYRGYWQGIGNTGSDGKKSVELFPGDIKFRALVGGTTSEVKTLTLTSSGGTVEFQTAKATAFVHECDGTPISGVYIQYYRGYWQGIGNTGSDGKKSVELFPGTIDFRALTSRTTSANKTLSLVSPGSTVEFIPAKVSIQFSGTVQYNRGYWATFHSPMYMFSGTYQFRFSGSGQPAVTMNLDISGCEVKKSILYIRLVDHSGNGLSGGKASWASGSWHGIPGSTDSNGVLLYAIDGLVGNIKVRMTYNLASKEITHYQPSNSFYIFQTTQAVIKLVDHAGDPLNGGEVKLGHGSWMYIGTTGDDGPGTVTLEIFPGSYKFRMSYNGGSQEITQDISTPVIFQTVEVRARLQDSDGNGIAGGVASYAQGSWISLGTTDTTGNTPSKELLPGTYKIRMVYRGETETHYPVYISLGGTNQHTEIFQTTTVYLQFSGNIKYSAGSWYGFTKPCMELLPGTYNFYFDSYLSPLTVSGNKFERSIIVIKLLDSGGNGINGATAKYYYSGWKNIGGQTGDDGSGTLVAALNGLMGNLKIKLTYAGSSNYKTQYQPTNSIYIFQTQKAEVLFTKSNGTTPISGATVKYYASGWRTFGSGTTGSDGKASMELLPGKYKVKLSYGGASVYQTKDITASEPEYIFKTGQVHSDSNTCTYYYASGWKTFTQDMELLPVKYKFRFSDGTSDTYYTITAGTTNHIH